MPKVFNKYKDEIPKGAAYIMRPSIYGNPYKIGPNSSREDVVQRHREWIMRPENEKLRYFIRMTLRGRDLVCVCKPHPCHGDVLLEIANGDDPI